MPVAASTEEDSPCLGAGVSGDADGMRYTGGMECLAEVIGKRGNRALVRVARTHCAECGGCGLLARKREQAVELSAVDRLGTRVGDEVVIEMNSRALSLAYLVVFGLPLLAMAAAYFLAAGISILAFGGGGQVAGALAAAVAGLASFWFGAKMAGHLGTAPVIVAVVAHGKAAPSAAVPSAPETDPSP